jgi:ribosomal protein S25
LLGVVAFALIGSFSTLTQADGPVKGASSGVFQDVPAGHWALPSLQYLLERGIIEGLPNGQFQGERAPSRYEVAVLLARALQYLEDELQSVQAQTLGPGPTPQTEATEQVKPEDIKVLQDLIFKISDKVQQLSGEVSEIKAQRPEIDPELADRIKTLEAQKEEIDRLKAQLAQTQKTVQELKSQLTKFQVQATTVSEETVAKTNQQVLANRIIGLFALGAAVVGVALATLR